jgi:hypothetical protein
MRRFLWAMFALCALGCGSEVTILGGNGVPSDLPGPVTPPDNPPDEPTPKICGASETRVTVSVAGSSCALGDSGVIEVIELEAAPEVDGVRVVATDCAITVAGVGTDLADDIALSGVPVQFRIEENWVEIHPLVACAQCTSCSCPNPLPILFAADAMLDDEVSVPRTVRVSRGLTTCDKPTTACSEEAFELDVTAFQIEGNINIDSAPITLGTVAAGEGEMQIEDGSGLRVKNLRSNGPGPECLAQLSSEAAWVVYRPVAYEL